MSKKLNKRIEKENQKNVKRQHENHNFIVLILYTFRRFFKSFARGAKITTQVIQKRSNGRSSPLEMLNVSCVQCVLMSNYSFP